MIKTDSKKRKLLLVFLCVFFVAILVRVSYIRYSYDIALQSRIGFALAKWKLLLLAKVNNSNGVNSVSLDNSAFVEFQTTACYGYCPEYRVNIFGDGTVEFEGIKNICRVEKFIMKIDKGKAYDLINKLILIDFFSLPNYTDVDVTDLFSVYIGLTVKNNRHTIRHYQGDISAPFTLKLIEEDIVKMVESLRVFGEYTPEGLKCLMQDGEEKIIPWRDDKRSQLDIEFDTKLF